MTPRQDVAGNPVTITAPARGPVTICVKDFAGRYRGVLVVVAAGHSWTGLVPTEHVVEIHEGYWRLPPPARPLTIWQRFRRAKRA